MFIVWLILILYIAEVGNYSDDLADQNYLSELKLLPNQSRDVERKIMEHHKEHL